MKQILDGWTVKTLYWCKYCQRWFKASTTTVVRCAYCQAETTTFAYIPNERMDGEEG